MASNIFVTNPFEATDESSPQKDPHAGSESVKVFKPLNKWYTVAVGIMVRAPINPNSCWGACSFRVTPHS